jgi:Domain of unknown function (DUF4386)
MDVRAVSRWFGAVSLVVAGVALTVGTAVEPSGDDDSVAVALGKISRHLGHQRWLIVTDLLAAFMLPAVLCLLRLARQGAPRLALAGGALAFTGWLGGLIGLGALDMVFYHGAQAADRAQATSLLKAVTDDWAYTVLLVTFIVGQTLGMLLLGAALWRARVAPRWAAALIALGPLAQVPLHDSRAASAAVYVLITLGLAGCAWSVTRADDADWDIAAQGVHSRHTAERSGGLVGATPAGG